MSLHELLRLEPHGPDTYVGTGPEYPWGGLYGGQIVTQALRAAAATVKDGFHVHSLRAYFIRLGDHREPIRFEVDRPRDGRSFCTRRVIARQAIGAILNLEASFHVDEPSDAVQTFTMPEVPGPDELEESSWSKLFSRRFVPGTDGRGLVQAWLKGNEPLGDDRLAHACALAYVSDDLPTDAVVRAHPAGAGGMQELDEQGWMSVSLDHTIWFHRPARSDEWQLHEMTCHAIGNARGLAVGHVFTAGGDHVATIAQEVLLRRRRPRT